MGLGQQWHLLYRFGRYGPEFLIKILAKIYYKFYLKSRTIRRPEIIKKYC